MTSSYLTIKVSYDEVEDVLIRNQQFFYEKTKEDRKRTAGNTGPDKINGRQALVRIA